MQIKSIFAGAAIALALGLGSASAGDESIALDGTFVDPVSAYATLNGMTTEPMTAAALAAVRGEDVKLITSSGIIILLAGKHLEIDLTTSPTSICHGFQCFQHQNE